MSVAGYSKTYPKYTNAIYANVNVSSSGDNTVIAGVTGQTIRIIKLILSAASTVTVEELDGSTIKGTFQIGNLVFDREDNPFILTSGNSYVLNLGSSISVTGQVVYVQD